MFGDNEPYFGQIHPDTRKVLEELTLPKSWDYDRFKRVIVALGIVGNGQSLPAPNRPDSIHLQGISPFVDRLISKTKQGNTEHAQPVFVDIEDKCFVMGRITHGTGTSVRLDTQKQPCKEAHQKLAGSIHTHPNGTNPDTSHGLSGQDYRTLLSDPQQQFMMITWGDENRMVILKTSVTPNNLEPAQINARIKSCEDEILGDRKKPAMVRVVDFNKTVCTEFGLTMYLADKNSRDLFNRINVV